MAMKWICGCLLAVSLLGFLADAQLRQAIPLGPQPLPRSHQQHHPQYPQQQHHPQYPQQPPPRPPQLPQRPPQIPPRPPQLPQRPPQIPQRPPQLPHRLQHTSPQPDLMRCLVVDHDKIRCGVHAISASECEAINCCFDGRTCFYGRDVTLQCTKDAQMIVVVARDATLPNIVFESIQFLAEDERCNPVGVTSAFAIYQFPITACGTVLTEESGVLIYENRMSSSFEIASGPSGLITRDSNFELLMQCRYFGTSVEAVVVEVGIAPAPRPVAALGPLDVELRLANGQCTTKGCLQEAVAYNSFYVDSDYPVTKVLRDPVYVEVRMLERTDPNLILTLGRCWATSGPNPQSVPQWDLLIDGCPYSNERYLTALLPMHATTEVLYPTHHKRFVFKMFAFVTTITIPTGPSSGAHVHTPLKEKLTIHCDTAVCIPALGYDCQPRCHRKGRDVAASGQVDSGEETVLVSSKEVVIIDPSMSLQ